MNIFRKINQFDKKNRIFLEADSGRILPSSLAVSFPFIIWGINVIASLVWSIFNISFTFFWGEPSFLRDFSNEVNYTLDALFTLSVFIPSLLILFAIVKLGEKRDISSLGFYKKGFILKYISGFLIGFIICVLCIGLLSLFLRGNTKFYYNSNFNFNIIWYFFIHIITWMIQGGTEEIFLRGYVFPVVSKRTNIVVGMLISSILFSTLHVRDGYGFLSFLFYFSMAMLSALLVINFDSIWASCGFHAAWNFTISNIIDFKYNKTNPISLYILEFNTKQISNISSLNNYMHISFATVLLLGCIIFLFILLLKKTSNYKNIYFGKYDYQI
ncbi:MAG: CPBP family intramembrane metalloprotease [Oscillospiraceae bacterium]|nr:CPBP family intramembrane metalloprotease [Oscillospiraceae bacterium]